MRKTLEQLQKHAEQKLQTTAQRTTTYYNQIKTMLQTTTINSFSRKISISNISRFFSRISSMVSLVPPHMWVAQVGLLLVRLLLLAISSVAIKCHLLTRCNCSSSHPSLHSKPFNNLFRHNCMATTCRKHREASAS